jgi:hypothetical protein
MRITFVLIPPGAFILNADAKQFIIFDDDDDKPEEFIMPKKIYITEPFYISKTRINTEQWQVTAGGITKPLISTGTADAYTNIIDCLKFIECANEDGGHYYRLPTMAEAEYIFQSSFGLEGIGAGHELSHDSGIFTWRYNKNPKLRRGTSYCGGFRLVSSIHEKQYRIETPQKITKNDLLNSKAIIVGDVTIERRDMIDKLVDCLDFSEKRIQYLWPTGIIDLNVTFLMNDSRKVTIVCGDIGWIIIDDDNAESMYRCYSNKWIQSDVIDELWHLSLEDMGNDIEENVDEKPIEEDP